MEERPLTLAEIITATRARSIGYLVIALLALGLLAELISIRTSLYNLRKARCDAAMSAVQVQAQGRSLSKTGQPSLVQDYVADCIE